jgi:DNA helicase-4
LRKGAPDSKGEASGEANSEISGAGSGQPAWVRAHNARYLERALEEERDYLDHVLDAVDPQIRLDQAQRRMVLTDEDNCLVIAGAGAGKTTSVAAKVKYLVDRKGVKPEEILVISFTNKAVEELRARIQRDLGIPCPICTFHSAGNAVLHMQNPERVNIVDADKKFFVVRDYLRFHDQ